MTSLKSLRGDVLYLHGWGGESWGFSAHDCPMHWQLQELFQGTELRIHAPSYHPDRDPRKTQLRVFLNEVKALASTLPEGRFTAVIGWSFGGWLASVLQEEWPEIVGATLLFAPGIDNVARNFNGDRSSWRQPVAYVEELKTFAARPSIKSPTVLVHGMLDDDKGGSAPWRAQAWANDNSFVASFFPRDVDHGLEPWLGRGEALDDLPAFSDLILWCVSTGHGSRQGVFAGGQGCARHILHSQNFNEVPPTTDLLALCT